MRGRFLLSNTSETVPVFDSLNTSMFGIAFVLATGLGLYRWWSNGSARPGSWISDATSAWSAMILALMALSAFTRTLPVFRTVQIPTEIELIRSNGLMIPFAFSYCSVMLARNLLGDLEQLLVRFRRPNTA